MKNKFKQETGSMAAYTIAMIMTFMIILGGIYFSNSAIRKNQLKTLREIKDIYEEDTSKVDEINETLKKQQLPAGGSFNTEKGVNTPKLGTGMTPIKWDETNQKFIETIESDKDWYDYNTQKWANAITGDGSYWVWIPRYSYQIADNHHTNSATGGTINIEFMKGTTNESSTGRTSFQNASGQGNWNIHPAFNYGSEVAGIWVAKFEASQSDSSTSSAGSSNIIKIQPTVQSWRSSITVNDIYTKCLNYNTALNSHQMKNVEWGAVSYLSKSKYGKENIEVGVNECNQYITGMGPSASNEVHGTAYAYNANYIYNTTQGKKASTTGNAYGVYDMSGGSYEYTAAYVNNGNGNLQTYGASLVNGVAKNKDVYAYNTSQGDDWKYNLTANSSRYGDTLYETSAGEKTNGNDSWFYDYSIFPNSSYPFFLRGMSYSDTSAAGVFSFGGNNGNMGLGIGFRPVLVTL